MNTTFLKNLRDLEITSLNPHFAHLKFESYSRSLECYIKTRVMQALDSILTHSEQSAIDPLMMTLPKALRKLHVGDRTMLPESLSPACITSENWRIPDIWRTSFEARREQVVSIVEVGGRPWDLAIG